MKKKLIVGILVFAFMTTMAFGGSTSAYIPANNPSTAVAIVDSYNSPNGGALAHTASEFNIFTFTLLPWANVTTGNLTQFQIVVLMADTGGEINLDETQRSELVQWVSNGGKLIMYDSELSSINYTWLPYPFSTINPGALGQGGTAVFKEDNTLGSTNPANTAYYVNTTDMAVYTDAVGDSNVVVTLDPHWCGDLLVINALGSQNWTKMYASYNNGLFLYNGLDIDYMSESTTPGTTGTAAIAKLFLLELLQPWGADYNLPCGSPLLEKENPVGGVVINPALMQPIAMTLAIALIAACFVVLATFYRKNSSHAIQ